jgi:hypothetical protein
MAAQPISFNGNQCPPWFEEITEAIPSRPSSLFAEGAALELDMNGSSDLSSPLVRFSGVMPFSALDFAGYNLNAEKAEPLSQPRPRMAPTHEATEVLGILRDLAKKSLVREREQAQAIWLRENADEYDGQWVALVGGVLIAANPSLVKVCEAIQFASEEPVLVRVSADQTPMIGG